MSDDLSFFGGIFLYALCVCLALAGVAGIVLAATAISGWIALSLLIYVPAAATGVIAFIFLWDEL